MLSGQGLQIAIAVLLGGAVSLGFGLHWLWVVLGGRKSDAQRLEEMAERLHEADLAREEAEAARQQAEATLTRREAETAEQLALMQARMDGEIEGREAELQRQLREAQVEVETLGDGLGNARQRIYDLEAEVEELRGKME